MWDFTEFKSNIKNIMEKVGVYKVQKFFEKASANVKDTWDGFDEEDKKAIKIFSAVCAACIFFGGLLSRLFRHK